MKVLLIGLLALGSISAFAKTEIHCETENTQLHAGYRHDGDINSRLDDLRQQGKNPSIGQLSVAVGGAGSVKEGGAIITKTCAVINY